MNIYTGKGVKVGWMWLVFCLYAGGVFSQQKTDPIAENMLLYQRYNGGWAKAFKGQKITYDFVLTNKKKAEIKKQVNLNDATIDNKATTREINYLLQAFQRTADSAYLLAAEKGIDYLLKAQYANGGWPQYYPDSSLYRSQVTFNDNAIINVMRLLQKIVQSKDAFAAVEKKYVKPCNEAINRGIDCILKTQLLVNGKRTVWNQQYNKISLLPEKARSFELVGLASSESAAIVDFLMRLPHPSAGVKVAIKSAMTWFEKVAIKGYRYDHIDDPSQPTGKDAILVKNAHSTVWARYYELGTDRPFFSGRDGVKKYDLKDIENERRAGYAWYGIWPEKLLQVYYPRWLKKYGH